MLKELFIQNIILMESTTISMGQGFHVFSGETGAGKTALLQALRLILGAKADVQLIRHGKEHASVKALFELAPTNPAFKILMDAGITLEDDGSLLIHRELTLSGKGKTYINNQLAQVSLLKQISSYLMEIVAQHASQELLDPASHRRILDTFGQHLNLLGNTQKNYSHLISLKKELAELMRRKDEQTKLQELWNEEFEEIDSAAIEDEHEEQKLSCEFEKLTSSQELTETLSKTYNLLQDDDISLIAALQTELGALERLNLQDLPFQKLLEDLRTQIEGLVELSFSLMQYQDSLEDNPERLQIVDERLKLLRGLMKRFGPQLSDVITHYNNLSEKLVVLSETSQHENRLIQDIAEAEKLYQKSVSILSECRKKSAIKLQNEIKHLLENLNLPNAQLIIELSEKTPDEQGAENIEFFLHANIGENKAALKDRASGGELSRVLLALKVLLFDLEETPTLIFDEIDSGVGGETAPKIAKLLKKMSQTRQLILITHLPQVAAFSDHHFEIKKIEDSSRTFSLVQKLNEHQKVLEIERMLGGKDLSKNTRKLAEDLIQSSRSS